MVLHGEKKKPARPSTGGAEYKERIPKGFASLGNGVVMRLLNQGKPSGRAVPTGIVSGLLTIVRHERERPKG